MFFFGLRDPGMSLSNGINRQGMLWIGFFTVVLAAWAALYVMVRRSPLSEVPPGLLGDLCLSAANASLGQLFAMWALMSAAMMLPTFVPALRTFLDLGATGATRSVDAAALVAGYGAVWMLGAGAGAIAQWTLAAAGLLRPDGASLSLWLTVALLLAAGLYQFSVLKTGCLAKCRMPLTFFMERWGPGPMRAARMGAELGVICFGCCWALMALAFVGGTMSLLWMGGATLFMVLEKLPDIGRYLTRPAGVLLMAASCIVALRAVFSI